NLYAMNAENVPIDTFLLANRLREQGLLEAIGGISYITELYETVPSVAHVLPYAQIVKDKFLRRQVISFADRLTTKAQEEEQGATEILENAEAEIYAMGESSNHSTLEHIGPIVADAYDNIGKNEEGLPTFIELDKYLNGLHKSDMIIIAARPGMGKTTFCINLAERAATRHKASVAFFSLEMSSEQLATRMLISKARVKAEHVKHAEKLTDAEMNKLSKAMEDLTQSNMYLDDTSDITVAEIRGKCRRLKKEKGLDLIVIDYIGLMQASLTTDKSNRQQQISEISRQLKGLAKELSVPVIVISQLNRASVKGDSANSSKEPDLSHLRESGALEQDADIVLFIHRPVYYNPEMEDQELAKIIIAKHRNGSLGRVDMTFLKDFTLFMEREQHHEDEGESIPPEVLAGYISEEPPNTEPPVESDIFEQTK
ncbi:MAG: replicative DNA helicase, partial [Clostridiales bacterium]